MKAFVIITISILAIVGVFYGVSLLLATFGWRSIAAVHPAPEGLKIEEVHRFQSLTMQRFIQYRFMIDLGVSDQGLYMGPSFGVFRTSHRSVFVPWRSIKRVEGSSSTFLVEGSGSVRITLPQRISSEVVRYLERSSY